MTKSSPAIETHHLRKQFGDNIAVADLSISVERGEIFGFLGPNGAGKTTSLKMLVGLISPTSGNGEVLGAPLRDLRTRGRIGFLPEHFRFHEWLTAVEFLTLHADLYHMPREKIKGRVQELLALVDLTEHANRQLRTFSKGMLQRIGLAQALLNDPGVVFLDEPTSGLDPIGRRLVRDITRDLSEKGTTVFLNSHFLSEVEVTCDRVAFINDGVIVRIDSLEALMQDELRVSMRVRNLSAEAHKGLMQFCHDLHVEGEEITFRLDSEDDLPLVNKFLVEQGVDVYTIHQTSIALEDLFLEIVGDSESEVASDLQIVTKEER
ncbi:MAG: ATP-binding cassette domain-containing protein [Anaerolineales bacterium]|nr:ATP-binding cassette domain-containing protein [Anaerolineales bacterium]